MSIGQSPSHPQAKLCKMAALPARLSQGPGVPVPGVCGALPRCMRQYWGKAVDEE